MDWVYDDGGRSMYFKGETGDCVVRAIAIATEQDYKAVYDDLAAMHKARYGTRSARNGTHRDDIKKYMADRGWKWHATMGIGTGCTTHLRDGELPGGRVMCSLSRHIATVVDGVLHDTYDSTRGGTRCVYGYWTAPVGQKPRKKRFREELGEARDAFLDGLMTAEQYADRVDALVAERGWR